MNEPDRDRTRRAVGHAALVAREREQAEHDQHHATANSSESPSRGRDGGDLHLEHDDGATGEQDRRRVADPPQHAVRAARASERCCDTMVVTATT